MYNFTMRFHSIDELKGYAKLATVAELQKAIQDTLSFLVWKDLGDGLATNYAGWSGKKEVAYNCGRIASNELANR